MKTMKKKIIFYNILLAGVFMASSCGDEFLTVYPEDTLTTDTFYKTPDQFKVAVNGAYAGLQSLYSSVTAPMYLYGEMRSDNTTFEGTNNQSTILLKQQDQFLEPLTAADGFFTSLYQNISRSNIILDLIDGSTLSDAQKAQIKGEASFLRASNYLQLVKLWGEVPLVLHQVKTYEEAFQVSATKASVTAIYNQIILDGTTAATSLPATYAATDRGRATKYAAKMLMADAYLTQGKYTEALTQLTGTDGVITGGVHSLITAAAAPAWPGLPSSAYAGIWGTANEFNKESIWEINYIQSDVYTTQVSTFHDTFAPNDANYSAGGVAQADLNAGGWGIVTTDMLNTFEANDQRKSLLITNFVGGNGKPIPYTTKYFSNHTTFQRYGNNWIVYRYAEALLIAAECVNKGGVDPAGQTALFYLNQVRVRAGLAPSALTGTAL